MAPWSVEQTAAHVPRFFGWAEPLAWVTTLAILAGQLGRRRRYAGAAFAAAGLALAGWLAWESWQLTRLPFRDLPFAFLPIDAIDVGWYLGLLAWVLALDRWAADAAGAPVEVAGATVWPVAVAPGLGLVRLGAAARGRLWLGAAAALVFALHATAVNPVEFQYYSSFESLPPNRPRTDVAVLVVLLAAVWMASLWDTWRQRREAGGDAALKPLGRRAT